MPIIVRFAAQSKGQHILMCPIGQAIVYAYSNGIKNIAISQFDELLKMNWDTLAVASLFADEDPDPIWPVCLDAVIAQKVELIWHLSESFWRKQGDR